MELALQRCHLVLSAYASGTSPPDRRSVKSQSPFQALGSPFIRMERGSPLVVRIIESGSGTRVTEVSPAKRGRFPSQFTQSDSLMTGKRCSQAMLMARSGCDICPLRSPWESCTNQSLLGSTFVRSTFPPSMVRSSRLRQPENRPCCCRTRDRSPQKSEPSVTTEDYWSRTSKAV